MYAPHSAHPSGQGQGVPPYVADQQQAPGMVHQPGAYAAHPAGGYGVPTHHNPGVGSGSYAPQPYAPAYIPYQPQPAQQLGAYQPHEQHAHPASTLPFMPGPASGVGPGYVPHPPHGQQGGVEQAFMQSIASGIASNPLNFMAAGSLLSAPQSWGRQYAQKVQDRMGWFTGGALNFHFAISGSYVLSKLLMLLAPFLRRWTYTRQPEQIQGGHKYRPPRLDINSPDLYIPLVAFWTYALLVCGISAAQHHFKPDHLYSTMWSAMVAWVLHLLLAKALLRAMAVPASAPWVELFAYTGYPFVPIVLATIVGLVAGRTAYYIAWAYGSLCMAIFLVRSIKRLVFQEARYHGHDLKLTNYLLLALALFQFPYAYWLGVRPHVK